MSWKVRFTRRKRPRLDSYSTKHTLCCICKGNFSTWISINIVNAWPNCVDRRSRLHVCKIETERDASGNGCTLTFLISGSCRVEFENCRLFFHSTRCYPQVYPRLFENLNLLEERGGSCGILYRYKSNFKKICLHEGYSIIPMSPSIWIPGGGQEDKCVTQMSPTLRKFSGFILFFFAFFSRLAAGICLQPQ